ncbi:hypothetical protein H6F89_03820 [Cyanobacteria bacterium FACHB-63]|nr:hypothetical protein [Cyanobacteria bacterium FACHB-63]
MKPNFEAMTREELRAYVLENREDDEALAALINRRNPNAIKYTTSDPEEIKEILRKKIAGEI